MSEIPESRRNKLVAQSSESTVVAEYNPDTSTATAYQSEAELEDALIEQLEAQAYEHLPIRTEPALIDNLRRQLEGLNRVEFSDSEWDWFFANSIAGANEGLVEKTRRIQDDPIQLLMRDDGTTKNISLIDKEHVHNNRLQIINQYEAEGRRKNRYDVTVLVNGLPMVHVELKRRGVSIREAFNQIGRYHRESFAAGAGLFQYVQLFVISNGTLTKYYSNTVREARVAERHGRQRRVRKTSNHFVFTSCWADARNRPIESLEGFARTFLSKHVLLNVLTRYCVFDAENKLLVMRPYQIAATERILERIETSANHGQLGSAAAGGYVWHTTGSGKTLTSFKAAQIAQALPAVDKVLFVVDRKDLDYQTMREYERFQKGAANSNTSTRVLKAQLEDEDARIVITTIQKLHNFVAANRKHPVYSRHVVMIFDECHRSQFGAMHKAITRRFKRYNLFGFTGTPVFAQNAPNTGDPSRRTTEQMFGDKLHTYTVVDAIRDGNVLPFRIDYIDTIRAAPDIEARLVTGIDTERVLLDPERIAQVTEYILGNFDRQTKRTRTGGSGASAGGYNALFGTASIEAAKAYYREFAEQQKGIPSERRLKIGLIYSYAANEEMEGGWLDDEQFDNNALDQGSRDFLEGAIRDYNAAFGTSYDTTAEKFENYYKDVSKRLKNRDLDLLIVVNMFLTGFDAKTLNTLWLDKNLRHHGLVQAFSRTNRILDSRKTFGNIISFRNLDEATNEAISLFGDKNAGGIVLLKPYAEYYARYLECIKSLRGEFSIGSSVVGDDAKKRFVQCFGDILRLRNILVAFDRFEGDDPLSDRERQDYQSRYLDIYAELRGGRDADKEPVNEDVVFEIELAKSVEIGIDEILNLVEERLKQSGGTPDKKIPVAIKRAIASSPTLRDKRELIEAFVGSVAAASGDVRTAWRDFVQASLTESLDRIIAEERLNPEQARAFVERAFDEGSVPLSGTAITRVLPPQSRFTPDNEHAAQKQRVLSRISALYNRFHAFS